ncbi:MAG: type II toxin-antitoxin system HicB family antitoxin [Patescibacteria group bacterium]
MVKAKNKKIHRVASYFAIFDPAEEGGYNVSFPDFPGCVTFGKNFEEARAMAHEALELWLEELADSKEYIPMRSSHPIIDEIRVPVPTA